jgi:hypothetical protein
VTQERPVPHDRMLHRLQERSFGYFVHEADPVTGLVLDKTAAGWPASIAATGMALTAYPIGVERGFLDREAAVERTLRTLRFLQASEQGRGDDASGHRGFYYHFLDPRSGKRAWNCELSTIDTALLMAGVLAAGAGFDGAGAAEAEIRALSRALYERVEWDWMAKDGAAIRHGWRPRGGFLPYRWEGYDEALVLYVLALGSPTHPIAPASYDAWCGTYRWRTCEGFEYLHAGPLFAHQFSHVWIDFRGIHDRPMRERGSDYFENSRRATLAQRAYAVRNPHRFRHVGALAWGITASDGPGPARRTIDGVRRSFFDYAARGIPDGPDDGTLAPWAVAASLPFAPEEVAETLLHFDTLAVKSGDPYGFKASFNPAFRRAGAADDGVGWVSPYHFGIQEGPTVLMIENHRTGRVWETMKRVAPLVEGLRRAGFEGGWLASREGGDARRSG